MFLAVGFQPVQVIVAVLIREKYILSSVTPLCDVVRYPGKNSSCESWHVLILAERADKQIKGGVPFYSTFIPFIPFIPFIRVGIRLPPASRPTS